MRSRHPSEHAKSPRENLMWVIFSLKNLAETQKYFIFARDIGPWEGISAANAAYASRLQVNNKSNK